MPGSKLRSASMAFGAISLAAGGTLAQATIPFWSSCFGGSGRDEIVAIRRGPGNLITVVGHTTSTDLPVTIGALQATNNGNNDVFVARLDASQPPSAQVLWCTYLGGSQLELAFDAEVDPLTGITTVVGVSLSSDFPAPGTLPFPTLSGPSDGFIAQIDPSGTLLLASMFFGGSAHDRVCEVEIEANTLVVTVGGVTEQQLPTQWTWGTVGPIYRGGLTDAFVARVDAVARQVQWATHLGGSSTEGVAFANWGGLGQVWEGNLDRMAMTVDPSGRPALVTVSFTAVGLAVTTPNAIQAMPTGAADLYLAVVNLPGPLQAQLHYGTYLGGTQDDRPRAIARHPGGGFVAGGLTFSSDFPVFPNNPMPPRCLQPTFQGGPIGIPTDGFICHVDPAFSGPAGLRYSTFLGGNGGEDAVGAITVETSGRITVAGYAVGGNFPTTPRCLQPVSASPQYLAYVARLQLTAQGIDDLLYSTFVDNLTGNTVSVLNALVLDDVGDAYVAGATSSLSAWPQQNPIPVVVGGREGAFTHLPLLPGGVSRDGLPFANPACTAALYTGAGNAPVPGQTFLVTANNAPPNGLGVLVLGTPIPIPGVVLPPPLNGTLLANPIVIPTVFADALGSAQFPIPIPFIAPAPTSWGLAAQWFFFTTSVCPGTGMLSSSERLDF